MITITLADAPLTWEPLNSVNGNMYFKLTSNTQSQTDFKYLFNPLVMGTTSSSVRYDMGKFPVPEAPLDVNGLSGYGLFTAEKLIREFVGIDLDPAVGSYPIQTPNPMMFSYVPYKMRYGFSYNPGLTFANTIISGTAVGLTFATPHGLVVGDIILINKSNKLVNPQYDGLKQVQTVLGTWSVVLNYAVGLTAYVETGNIDYLERFTATSSTYYGFNGTRQYDQEYITDSVNYFRRRFDFTEFFSINSSGISRFLTDYYVNDSYQENNYNRAKKVYSTNYESVSAILNLYGSSTYSSTYKIITYTGQNANNLTISSSFSFPMPVISTYSYHMYNFPAGPKNLNNMVIGTSNVDYYSINLYTSGSNVAKASYLYQIVNNCSVYDNVRIAFRNRYGAFEFWNFNLDSKNTMSVSRKEYKKNLPYQYDIGARQQSIYSQEVMDSWSVNTDWIDEYDYKHLKQLISSNEVYLIDETSYYLKTGSTLYEWIEDGSGEFEAGGYDVLKYPIIITDTSYEVKTAYRNKQFNLTLNYKMANPIITQNK